MLCQQTQALARGRLLNAAALSSFAKEICIPGVLDALTADNVVRLLWALASPCALTKPVRKPSSLALEINAALVKAGKSAASMRALDGSLSIRDGDIPEYFTSKEVLDALHAIASSVQHRLATRPGDITPSHLATVAWSLAMTGLAQLPLFRCAYPDEANTAAWDAIPHEVSLCVALARALGWLQHSSPLALAVQDAPA